MADRRSVSCWATANVAWGLTCILFVAPCALTQPPPASAGSATAPSSSPARATDAAGWTVLTPFASDGTRAAADPGSRIAYLDVVKGNNETGAFYWWDGQRLVDQDGSDKNAQGVAYGTDPLLPNEQAIKPFAYFRSEVSRLFRTATNKNDRGGLQFPDWYLFRRGQRFPSTGNMPMVGESQERPAVFSAYGPMREPRPAICARLPDGGEAPGRQVAVFSWSSGGGTGATYSKIVSLEFANGERYRVGGIGGRFTSNRDDDPNWKRSYLRFEDCLLRGGTHGFDPCGNVRTEVFRCIVTGIWNPKAHNQGFGPGHSGTDSQKEYHETSLEDCIFYKNGYKTDPATDPNPRRDIFSRNFYMAANPPLGLVFKNVISADGASGGPQMRFGAKIENSLIIEGYWFSSTGSNGKFAYWLPEQKGSTAIVRNNVQFPYKFPNPNQPSPEGKSSPEAQPGGGYRLGGASYGAIVEGNVISGAMMLNDLGFTEDTRPRFGSALGIEPKVMEVEGKSYTQRDNTVRNNILYRTERGLVLGGDYQKCSDISFENNAVCAEMPIDLSGLQTGDAKSLKVANNRFYFTGQPNAFDINPDSKQTNAVSLEEWEKAGHGVAASGNTVAPAQAAAQKEKWPDPDRTLKRYVKEVLKLELVPDDPMGLKTFMTVATCMRKGGSVQTPRSGQPKPADYEWDNAFTAQAVVNWVREGFGLPPVS